MSQQRVLFQRLSKKVPWLFVLVIGVSSAGCGPTFVRPTVPSPMFFELMGENNELDLERLCRFERACTGLDRCAAGPQEGDPR